MISTETSLENLTLNVQLEMHVNASLQTTFEALLEELGPSFVKEDGTPLHGRIEPWPGGRWYRDLGDGNGHWWGSVQAINRPTLLEFAGPLFMSYPVMNNVQYRLSEEKGGTLIKFHHTAVGLIIDEHRKGVVGGWNKIADGVKKRAEAMAAKAAR